MTNPFPIPFSVLIAAWLLLFSGERNMSFAQSPAQAGSNQETFAPITLRGYGTVSGTFQKEASGSVLKITCQDADKAKLTQAKYLSDLSVLPGVKEVKGSDFTRYEVQDQGSVAAFRDGKQVVILAARNEKNLIALVKQMKPAGITVAQAQVPMYLDRWDKYGWRFYYRLNEFPKGTDRNSYNLLKDFDEAEALDHCGFLFWDHPETIITGIGLMAESPWDWAPKAANLRHLPVAINGGMPAGYTPPWVNTVRPEDIQRKMPQFSGQAHRVADPFAGGQGFLSWVGDTMQDYLLGMHQQSFRRFATLPSVISFMEPHGELHHGDQDILLEYGPEADANYRKFLKAKYETPEALSKRWFGAPGKIAAWNDIRVPELASFIGWNDQAIDLQGNWAVNYEELADGRKEIPLDMNLGTFHKSLPSKPAPKEWFEEKFDDSQWPRLPAPGHDQVMFAQHRPAVFRRDFQLDAAKLRSQPRWWLYVWDFNDATNDKVIAFLNGQEAGTDIIQHSSLHWAAFDVTRLLKPGANQIALRLPKGYLGYRVYLSPEEPKQYPRLGEGRNAQWVDFCDWTSATRLKQLRRGLEMTRQVDVDRQITLASPDYFADGVKSLAKEFGGEFHNTGYMGAWYADYLPGLMRGAGLPFSVELGGPDKNLEEFKRTMGNYLIEGIQGVDYYMHIGDVLWNPEIRKNFEDNLRLYKMFGKYHAPQGEIGVLFATRAKTLTDFPWSNDPNVALASNYFTWNISAVLRGGYEWDNLSESSFADGDAGKYRVIMDSNTSIMDEQLLPEIEKWVRAGGIFVTSGQTGRHTPTQLDAWPISRLSGYAIARVDKHAPGGAVSETHKLALAPGQTVFSDQWKGVVANGLGLKKIAPECQDLLRWDDGSIAVGMRRLGKGAIIHVGVKFGGARDFVQRVELNPGSPVLKQMRDLYTEILESQKVPKSDVSVTDKLVFARHYQSNNGLYDIWTVVNGNREPVTTRLAFGSQMKAKAGIEISTGAPVQFDSDENRLVLKNIELDALQSRGYLSPRDRIEDAPRHWFALQRNWWQGGGKASGEKFPEPQVFQNTTLDLIPDWAFKPLNAGDDPKALSALKLNDTSWKRMRLGIWTGEYPDVKHGLLRKKFRVPAKWNNGPVTLWLQNWSGPTFSDNANVYLDGELLAPNVSSGIPGRKIDTLKAGSEHVLALEISGKTTLVGSLAGAWLTYLPKPVASQDLAGDWMGTKDALRYETKLNLPGAWEGWLAGRTIRIAAAHKGKNVFLHFAGTADLTGVIINGRWIRQDHHQVAKEWLINITPWVKFGEENEIQIGRMNGPGTGAVQTLSLDFYEPGMYP